MRVGVVLGEARGRFWGGWMRMGRCLRIAHAGSGGVEKHFYAVSLLFPGTVGRLLLAAIEARELVRE